jgi:hypothetical protein
MQCQLLADISYYFLILVFFWWASKVYVVPSFIRNVVSQNYWRHLLFQHNYKKFLTVSSAKILTHYNVTSYQAKTVLVVKYFVNVEMHIANRFLYYKTYQCLHLIHMHYEFSQETYSVWQYPRFLDQVLFSFKKTQEASVLEKSSVNIPLVRERQDSWGSLTLRLWCESLISLHVVPHVYSFGYFLCMCLKLACIAPQ